MSVLRKIKKHFTPALGVAFVALVFAVTGVSFAATGGGSSTGGSHATLTASAAKSKAKTKAGPRGPAGPKGATGATGATGPAGATGPGGPAGAAGAKGENGGAGTNGTNGTNGEPGKPGKPGAEGSPWTDGGVLPPEKTEKGTWGFSTRTPLTTLIVSVSFPIPLGEELAATAVHYVGPGETVTDCPGSVQEPKAAPGNLCVYQGAVYSVTLVTGETAKVNFYPPTVSVGQFFAREHLGAGKGGALVNFEPDSSTEPVVGWGSWAVTAPAEA